MTQPMPVHIILRPTDLIPYEWDMASYVAADEVMDAVTATVTRIVPPPDTDVTAETILAPPSSSGTVVTIQLNGSLFDLNAVYRLDITFMPNVNTTQTVQSFIYVRNVNPYPENGISLLELRQRCGSMLNDMILTEATYTNASDDKASFTDINNITLPTGELKNRIIYFYSGTKENIGQQRTIRENFPEEGRLLWNMDLPQPPKTGDKAELWNHRAQGIRPQQMNEFIKIAHSEASVYNHVVQTITITDDFTSTEPSNTIVVPMGVSKIERVQYMTVDQVWVDVDRSDPGGPGYWVDEYNRVLTINRPISTWASGSVVRLIVRGREQPLLEDSDTTRINAEWICARACELACTALVNRNPDQNVYRDKMYKYERVAQSMRTLIVPRTKAGTTLEW